jgi:hypothetical protein
MMSRAARKGGCEYSPAAVRAAAGVQARRQFLPQRQRWVDRGSENKTGHQACISPLTGGIDIAPIVHCDWREIEKENA